MRLRAAAVAFATFLGVAALFAWGARAFHLDRVPQAGAPMLLLLMYAAPLVAGLAAGLAAAAVSRAPWGVAAATGAASGAPAIFAWGLAWFGGILLLPLVPFFVAWVAAQVARNPAAPRPWWPGPALALAAVLLVMGAGAALEPPLEGGRIVLERAHDAPYEPLDMDVVIASDPPGAWDVDNFTLELLERDGRLEMDFFERQHLEHYLQLYQYRELRERSLAAGVDPPRFVFRHQGALYEYAVAFEQDAPRPNGL